MLTEIHKNKFFKILLAITILLFVWTFCVEPNLLVTKNITVKNEDLKGIKITIAGDFHLKKNDEKRLQKTIKVINETDADLILLLGDYVKGHKRNKTISYDKINKNFKNLRAKNGIFAILGNHDIWISENETKNSLNSAGITVLDNENKKIKIKNKMVTIAGTNDMTENKADIAKTLKNAQKPTILITHNPDIFPFVPEFVDFTVAGHTHGGQVVFPLFGAPIVPSNYGQRYASGLVVENGKNIFITKGIGTSILPVRFNCTPEIVTITFE